MSVLSHLENTASALVLSSSERDSISRSITTLQKRLGLHFEGGAVVEHLRFGSSTRETILPRRADERSDIDYMIVFNNANNLKPQTFINRLKKFAESYYPTSEIYQSHPTVVLNLNHIKFELVPSYRNWWNTLYIPAPASGFSEWISTDPNGFNQELQQKNKSNGYQIKPLIRLLKYWNAENGYVYNSYDLEQKIVGQGFWGCTNLKDYLFSVVDNLSTWQLPQYKIDKVNRAKAIVNEVRELEANGYPATAESKTKLLIPLF